MKRRCGLLGGYGNINVAGKLQKGEGVRDSNTFLFLSATSLHMKLLFILENFHPHIGGVETLFRNLTAGLAKEGHEVTVLTHKLAGTLYEEIIEGVRIIRVPCLDSRYLFSFAAIPMAIRLAKHADIIHTTTYNAALPALIAAKIGKKPSLITIHEILGEHWGRFTGMPLLSAAMHQWIEKRIARARFDSYIAVSESTMRQLLEANPKARVSVIYNSIDHAHFHPELHDGSSIRDELGLANNFVCLTYGRPGITKGIEHVIDAASLIAKAVPSAKLVLILSKSPLSRYIEMKQRIEKSPARDAILLLEPKPYPDLPRYIKAADCVIVPSLTEGFGYTAAEASSLLVPVVASNTTSLPEVVSGKHVLVEPGSAKAIAQGVLKIYRKEHDEVARKTFTIGDCVKNYIKAYRELIEEKR